MKKLVVLSGNSVKNRDWGEAVVERFRPLFDEAYMQYYDHWESGEEVIDFEREAEKLKAEVEKGDEDTEYYVFAKSFGSVLTLLSTSKGYISPKRCVFFGMPLNLVEEQNIFGSDWTPLRNFVVPSIAFQNIDDPVASYTFLKEKFTEFNISDIQVIRKEGDNHAYTELEEYEEEITQFLEL